MNICRKVEKQKQIIRQKEFEKQAFRHIQSMTQIPSIKIIPPNPVTHSILIVYCYTNNKMIQCQPKWTRLQPYQQTQQNRQSRSQTNLQTSNTYKCTPLDYNHCIEVEAMCEFGGRMYKLVAKTQAVKASKELLERKQRQKTVACRISSTGLEIQAVLGLESSRVVNIFNGPRQFNLEIPVSNIFNVANNSFKARIHSHRYEFLTFFNDCLKQKINLQQSLGNFFEFSFGSDADKDLILLKIAQNCTTYNTDKPTNYISQKSYPKLTMHSPTQANHQTFNLNQISIELKSRDLTEDESKSYKTKRNNIENPKNQPTKKQGAYSFKTPDPKSANSAFHYNPFSSHLDKKERDSGNKKQEAIKLPEPKVSKKSLKQHHSHNSVSQNEIRIRDEILVLNQGPFSPSNEKTKPKSNLSNQNKECLDIFDEEDEEDVQGVKLQSSSPQFYGQIPAKPRPITNYVQNPSKTQSKEDLPSINLRGSFEQLQNTVPQINSTKKIKQKVKTQTSRQLSYQYPKNRQKTQLIKTPPGQSVDNDDSLRKQISQLKKQNKELIKLNEELKKYNLELQKQVEQMNAFAKENYNLKKKYFQLSEEMSKLEMQKKQILADKLKWESSYHKQKTQKETTKKQLQDLIKLVQKNPFLQQQASKSNLNSHNYKSQITSSNDLNEQPTKLRNVALKYPAPMNLPQKRSYFPDMRQKTPPNRALSSNQILGQQKGFQSNTQSRKELRFPSYSYKYGAMNGANSTNAVK